MKPIVKWTLWQRRWSTAWWVVGIVAYMVVVLAFYPPFRDQASHLDQTITSQIPSGARSFIADSQDWFSPIGYLSSQIFYLMMPLLLGILAIGLGSSLVAREEDGGTIELLLARPLSRAKLLGGKALAGFVVVTVAAAGAFVSGEAMVRVINLPVSAKGMALAVTASWLLALAFGAIAFMIAALGRARSASIGLATVVALGGYMINSLASTAKVLDWPAKFMPFHYYHPSELLGGTFHITDFAVFVGIIVICGIIALTAFRQRDLD